MNPRQFLRNLGHLLGELIPWQLVDTVRDRDYDAAVLAAADALASEEERYDVFEPLTPGGDAGDTPLQSPPPPGPTLTDLQFAAGVVKAYAALGDMYDTERADLRALADRLTQ